VREIEWSKPNVRLQVGEEENVDAAAEGVENGELQVSSWGRAAAEEVGEEGAAARRRTTPSSLASRRWSESALVKEWIEGSVKMSSSSLLADREELQVDVRW
jgi:hypothetical protein